MKNKFKVGDKVLCWKTICTIYACSDNGESYILLTETGYKPMVNKRLLKRVK